MKSQRHARVTAIRGMSEPEALALPVTFPLEPANKALGLGRTVGYALAKRGEYPIPVLRVGNVYRCRRSDLLAFLGITQRAEAA